MTDTTLPTRDARVLVPWATDHGWCQRELRPGDLKRSQALYACAKHAGAGIVADAVRTCYLDDPRLFARFADDEFHELMIGAVDA